MIRRKLRFLKTLAENIGHGQGRQADKELLTASLGQNLDRLQTFLGDSKDIVQRKVSLAPGQPPTVALIFVDGLVDTAIIDEHILRPLMHLARKRVRPGARTPAEVFSLLQANLVPIGEIGEARKFGETLDRIVSGDTCLLLDGVDRALILNTRGWEKRAVQEPLTEASVRGPREGFTETLRTNTALLRRRIKDPELAFDTLRLGRRTKTDVCVAYLRGVTRTSLVDEIKRRLRLIDTDSILDSGYIEQFVEDAPLSPFATVGNSERPDVVAAKILEGRAAILVDGAPIVLTVPLLFVESFQTPDDYYSRPYYGTLVRWVRYGAFMFSVLSPAIYVALTAFHQELIPTPLLISFTAAREGLPFPTVLEALGMGLVFETLREAGVRIPRPFGQAVSIVGALVIGDTAVRAGLVGAPMVIVVALTAITSFVVPAQQDVGTIMRVLLTIMAGLLGAVGIAFGLLAVLVHLVSLRSFGVPYLLPLTPLRLADLKDVVVRAPWWAMFTRPSMLGQHDPERQKFRLMPTPQGHEPEDQAERR